MEVLTDSLLFRYIETKTKLNMKTVYYVGNYTLSLGYPYVIISAEEKNNVFHAEKIIIFESFKRTPDFLAYRISYPNISGGTVDDFILSQVESCKDDIYYKILLKKYEKQLESLNYNVSLELRETNRNILNIIRDKFPNVLDNIESNTQNGELKSLIGLYKSIVVTRNDFDIT